MRAIFFDRDDTLIKDTPDYCVDSIEKIKFFHDTLPALNELSKLTYSIFIVTNQEVIANGRLDQMKFDEIHQEILKQLAVSGAKIVKTYVCPHNDNDSCDCRKPKVGMLLEAASEFNVNLSESWFVGDRSTDMAAGKNAGCKTILVQTAQIPALTSQADYIAPTLIDAAHHIIATEQC